MVRITVIPVSTATSQQLMVEITEELCKKVCVNAGRVLSGSVQFSAGTPEVLNGVALVPITATGAFVMAGACGKCGGDVRHFAERFTVPFVATATNAVTITPGASTAAEWVDVSCCHTTKAKLTATLTVAIA